MRKRHWYLDLNVLIDEIEKHEIILGRKVCCYSDFPYWLHSAVWRYIKHNNILKLKDFLNSINRDSDYEIVSLCGHYTTSLAELIVCNFLHLNNISHEFNHCLPNSKMRYDHKIEIDGLTLYLEQTLYQKENISKRCVKYFEKWNKKHEYYNTNNLNYLFLGREYFETSVNIIDKKLKHILDMYIKNMNGIYEPYQLLSHSQYNLEVELKKFIIEHPELNGYMPKSKYIQKCGNRKLCHTISFYGGIEKVANLFNISLNHTSPKARLWTKEEDEIIIKTQDLSKLCAILNNRSKGSIAYRKTKLGLTNGDIRWTAEEDNLLIYYFSQYQCKYMAENNLIPNRNQLAISARAGRLKLYEIKLRPWNDFDDFILRERFLDCSNKELAIILMRSKHDVEKRLKSLQLSRRGKNQY